MDTITHGIAGALIAKAFCRGEDMFAARPINRGRIISWSLMLGAIFPDSDVLRDMLSSNQLLILTWHRSITHSLLLLPLWTLLLAAITRAFAKSQKWEAPSFATLAAIYAVGLLSHILLDLVTSFGTMIWSPLQWSRPAWDLIFIVDFTLTALFLAPQLLAWIYSDPGKIRSRAVGVWLVFVLAPLLIAKLAENVGAPISVETVLAVMLLFTLIFYLPSFRGRGVKVRYATWNRLGFLASLAYIGLALYTHHSALARIQKFAELDHLQVRSIGALPLPPSLLHWDGLVRTDRGVYELRMDLSDRVATDTDLLTREHHYYPDAPPNSYVEAAKQLPEVQKVLWFARFPVTRFHKESDAAVVEISDIRFMQTRRDRAAPFTYRVRFDTNGGVLSQGWVK